MLITDYLDQLDIDKDTLYNNLVNAGISASQDETFTTLCPKVGELTTDLIDEFKPSINITGVNITDEPLSEYPEKLNEGLINVLNNGTDVIFNNYPNKETKEGSSQIFSDCVNAKMKIQEKGYLLQYGGTPTPSNPIPVYTVTGDNYIEISNADSPSQKVDYFLHLGVENLYNANKLIPGYLPNSGAYPTTSESWPNSKYLTFPIKAGHTLYIKNVNDVNNVASLKCIDKTTNEVVTYIDTQENNYFTSTRNFSSGFDGAGTVTAKVDFIVGLNIKDPSLTFSVDMVINDQYISENPIELCKIPNTDYQDTFVRSNGKNLLNSNNFIINYVQNANDGNLTYNASFTCTDDLVGVEGNSTYCVSSPNSSITRIMITEYSIDGTYNTSKGRLEIQNGGNFHTANNTRYVRIAFNSTTDLRLQLEKGSQQTTYEPYGNGIWYVYKEIGKVVLNGTQGSWAKGSASGSTYSVFQADDWGVLLYVPDITTVYSDKLVGGDNFIAPLTGEHIQTGAAPNAPIRISILNSRLNEVTSNGLNEYLATNNITCYIPLKTPTYTKITDTNLSNELEQIYSEAKSYAGRTQVTAGIIGDSAPMVLETTVLKEMN